MTQFARSILVSDWASSRFPVIERNRKEYVWDSEAFDKNIDEKYYLKLKRKFFCKCGHESKGHLTQVTRKSTKMRYSPNKAIELPEINTLTDPYIFEGEFVCPECGAAPDVILPWVQSEPIAAIDYVMIFDNRNRKENNNSICLAIGMTSYYFNRNCRKIGAKTTRVRLTNNIETGMTYAIKLEGKRQIRNCSYGNFPSWMNIHLNTVGHNEEHRVRIEEYARLVFGARIHWLNFDNIVEPNSRPIDKLLKAMQFSALPQLQCLPFRNYILEDPKDRAKIRKAGFNGKALWELFIGTSSKKIRKLIRTEQELNLYRIYGALIKDENNMYKLMQPLTERSKTHYYGRNYIEGLAPKKDVGYRHDMRYNKEVYEYMINIHRDETHFVNCLLKVKQQNLVYPNNPGNNWAAPPSPETHRVWDLNYAWNIVLDCTRMVENILMRDITYKVIYRNDIKEFHDRLSRDLDRYRNPFKKIPYTQEEASVYNREVKGYRFVLAKSNHELTRVGSEQNICVGGYGDRAVRKQCVIVLVSNEKGEHRLTIELQKQHDTNSIVINQAKLYRNAKPEEKEANIVAEWCYQTNTIWDSCYDLGNAQIDLPRIPGGQPPIWHEQPTEESHQAIRSKRAEVRALMGLATRQQSYVEDDYLTIV